MHNIGSSCTKPSLTGLFSRVHNSDETQLTHLKCCTHVNKHLVNNVWKNNFIMLYCFWMISNILEYTFFRNTRYQIKWPCQVSFKKTINCTQNPGHRLKTQTCLQGNMIYTNIIIINRNSQIIPDTVKKFPTPLTLDFNLCRQPLNGTSSMFCNPLKREPRPVRYKIQYQSWNTLL